MKCFTIPELEKGEEYSVRMYPTNAVLRGVYVGLADGWHFFSGRMRDLEGFIRVNQHFMCEEGGDITHKAISSISVLFFTKDGVMQCSRDDHEKLRESLKSLGVEL